ncbi:PREDICTED: sterile alpha motif domain-containing protein 14 isoform X1 [Cercocebus atys]|uniref:sterile alpha motif domain-containing protein 14 isoform X1 n=2 Tax=Cercocebus atys TaxID=9531 RepID=UPI0005F538A0|nr:PREDICTED: sterile alpha motif domain-containing protein 14 isoform X1 [Cercocebus atys]XP_011901579.1 PREDICTED: sterile alpha motif domain-containing protein 14 isoform X1 [Cercocebus atys]
MIWVMIPMTSLLGAKRRVLSCLESWLLQSSENPWMRFLTWTWLCQRRPDWTAVYTRPGPNYWPRAGDTGRPAPGFETVPAPQRMVKAPTGPEVTDGCGSPLHRLRSPLHSGPGSPAGGSFCLDPPGLRRSLDEDEPPPSPLTRYRPLHNAASHEGLAAASCSPPRSAPSSDSSPSFVRRHPRAEPHSEDDSRDASPPEPASPTIGLDKKTRRKFLDLGVTLRRASTGKSRKEKGSNRLSMGSRESVEGSGRSGVSPFLPFSWFTDSGKGSASSGSTTSPACSPKHEDFSPKKSASQESTLSDDSTPPSSSPKIPSGPRQEVKCSYPYHTLSQSSDEFLDEPLPPVHHWTSQQVGQWLQSLNLEQYAAEFAARQVDGPQLLQLDGSKLKSLGLSNSHDRALVKRKLKELAAAAEKERKAQEKAARQREKLRRREQEAKKS